MAPIRCCFDQTAVWHSDAARGPSTPSFNHRVREGEQFVWYRKPERVGGPEIDDQIEFNRLLDRNLSGLCSAQYLIDEIGGTPPHAQPVRSIGHQPTRFDVLSHAVQRGKPCA